MKTNVINSILAAILFSTLTLTSCEEEDNSSYNQQHEILNDDPTTDPDPETETEDDEPNGGRESCYHCTVNDTIIKKEHRSMKAKNK